MNNENDLYIVDAFASRRFTGNPAAVCLAVPPGDGWRESLAAEMNLSETAFLSRRSNGEWDLRWFTPKVEVDLCGHATLASAHVLWEAGLLPREERAVFATRSGRLTCVLKGSWIEMDFPAEPPQDFAAPAELAEALGVRAVAQQRNRMDILVELADEAAVRALEPDRALLAGMPARGIIVTARSAGREFDFVSRFFAPAAGIPEDPVTGSAHCCLAPYWSAQLGKANLTGCQVSARGGIVKTEVRGDRVLISGQAVTVLRGQLSVA
jgi:PhzF family phenazine biosynthesis protein